MSEYFNADITTAIPPPGSRSRLGQAVDSRFGVLYIAGTLFLVTHSALRVALSVASGALVQNPLDTAGAWGLGVVSDLYPLAMLLAVPAVLLAAVPERVWRTRSNRWLIVAGLLLTGVIALIAVIAEWLFWAEFDTRFNFLAVEYLVYRDEVLGNIRESYDLPALLGGVAAVQVFVLLSLRVPLARALRGESSGRSRVVTSTILCAAAVLAAIIPAPDYGADARSRELSHSGPYQLVSAYRNNELDYTRFYRVLPPGVAMHAMRKRLGFEHGSATDVLRHVPATRPERKLNVVIVMVESLSASFLGAYGNGSGLTPHLDALAQESLWFSNLYATGTRTVRGLEAVTLSIPPTPGNSIVRRPEHGGLRTIGTPFQQRGYDTAFIYGGFGYFDNMNAFFGDNGFRVVDRASLSSSEVTFSNAWGVADENLFDRVLKEADADAAVGRPFMYVALTTSNHRPYTFPEQRIDAPQRRRESAVRYTDWAINRFLEGARSRPWFKDTVFVVMADHCARSGGQMELPIENFRIPLFVYAPGLVQPDRVARLASQIDFAPTLLDLLGFEYDSTFFGRSVFDPRHEPRALTASYSNLGLFSDNRLTVLLPKQKAVAYAVEHDVEMPIPLRDSDVAEAISYYQSASEVYRSGGLRADRAVPGQLAK